MARHKECLDQLTCISLTPSVRTLSMQLVATLFVCMAYTPSTHPYLTKPLLVRRLLEACSKERKSSRRQEEEEGEEEEEDENLDVLMLR